MNIKNIKGDVMQKYELNKLRFENNKVFVNDREIPNVKGLTIRAEPMMITKAEIDLCVNSMKIESDVILEADCSFLDDLSITALEQIKEEVEKRLAFLK